LGGVWGLKAEIVEWKREGKNRTHKRVFSQCLSCGVVLWRSIWINE